MVPSDYRLDEVCSRLIPRLEASRRSFRDPSEMEAAFRGLAREHVRSAMAEYGSVLGDDRYLERQVVFLEKEVLETFLPRYLVLATARTRAEEDPSRVEAWGRPAGRLILIALAIVALYVGGRFIARPFAWPPLLFVALAPLWPDGADYIARRQHRAALQAIVDDMQSIQDQASSYLPPELLDVEEPERPRSMGRAAKGASEETHGGR